MSFERVNPEFVPVENGTEVHNKENGTVPETIEAITFGSHDSKAAVDGLETNLPKDVVDDWPEDTQQFHCFFVKYRFYEDLKIKAKLDAAERDLQNKKQARFQIIDKIKEIRSKRFIISEKIGPLSDENNKFKAILDGKKREMEPVNQALSQLRPNNSNRDRGVTICSSEGDLNRLIKSLQYHIQHESIPLTEEKQILREIKQLEGTRAKVIEKAAERAKILESLGSKVDLHDQYKLMGDDFSGVKKERQVVSSQLKQLLEERSAVDKDIKKLEDELKPATEKCEKAMEALQELRKQRDEGNACFRQNGSLLFKARNLAITKDVEALKEFTNSENEKFMKMWNESKAFRDDYVKRILPSFDIRGLCKDGRQRNPEEKQLFAPEETKNNPVSTLQNVVMPSEKESKSKPIKEVKETKKAHKEPNKVDLDDEEKVVEVEKPKKVEKKVDEAKLKEIRREEEIAKAKQALERKKKLAEKAAVKAAIKAQKEAEKKEKGREKKLKKKASAPGLVPEAEEQPTEAEVAEPEEATEELIVSKSKGRKETVMRNRTRSKGPDSISKAMLKRKKSTNYWVWAAPAAVSVMMVFVVGYKYLI